MNNLVLVLLNKKETIINSMITDNVATGVCKSFQQSFLFSLFYQDITHKQQLKWKEWNFNWP
jgi:hypothetical protein